MAKIATASEIDRFWARVRKSDACWEWTACLLKTGYGQAQYAGRNQSTHRIAWQINFGDIPDGLCVLHHCDNRRCVRPEHLFLGSIADNNRDAASKNRCARSLAKLTVAQVHEIRTLLAGRRGGYKELAARYGVHFSQIGKIAREETWRRV